MSRTRERSTLDPRVGELTTQVWAAVLDGKDASPGLDQENFDLTETG